MRVVGGELKGRVIAAPKGRDTRPTSDRARETLFNILAHADWTPPLDGARIMDVYAGSGALGIEALSRGAGFCLFVESGREAKRTLAGNLATLGLKTRGQLYRRGATDLGNRSSGIGEPFSLVFMDPPYDKGLVRPALHSLMAGNWLTPDALIIAETGLEEIVEPAGWEIIHTRAIGAAKIWFLKRPA